VLNPNIQQIYSAIVVRGRRNAPTINEVQRDAASILRQAEASMMESRF